MRTVHTTEKLVVKAIFTLAHPTCVILPKFPKFNWVLLGRTLSTYSGYLLQFPNGMVSKFNLLYHFYKLLKEQLLLA